MGGRGPHHFGEPTDNNRPAGKQQYGPTDKVDSRRNLGARNVLQELRKTERLYCSEANRRDANHEQFCARVVRALPHSWKRSPR